MTIKRDPRRHDTPNYINKSKNINVRVTPGEHERIRAAGARMGLNITQFVERLIFGEKK